jgi:NAD(P)-dependent dehydrogenase (short-subunit alcohol dehydrogenase family)
MKDECSVNFSLFKAAEQGQDPQTVGFEHPMHQLLVFYGVSKIGVNTLTRIEARDWKYPGKNVLISAICPDFCQTDMNGNAKNARPPEMGADSILHGVYDENIENGQFWRDGKRFPNELEPKKTTLSPAVLELFQEILKKQQQQ